MINEVRVQTEMGIRNLIKKQLRKETHPGTKPSIDFIVKILEEAHEAGTVYDVSDMRNKVLTFAMGSTNHSKYCVQQVSLMKFKSDSEEEVEDTLFKDTASIVFFDIEIFPNLFIVCWKYKDSDKVVRMINPGKDDVKGLFSFKLIGFNNRRYDNHMLYAASLGYTVEELYHLSSTMIKDHSGFFREAYNLSYSDIYDFSNKKQGLKKWMIELNLIHKENKYPWDEPLPEDKFMEVINYCENDVRATEFLFDYLADDWKARLILCELTGLSPNTTTQKLAAGLIFGNDRAPQSKFIYTDLSKEFPGYKYSYGKSTYLDEEVGEGGYNYSEPGIYHNIVALDIASMHPTSIEKLQLFGPYTKVYSELKEARLAIKHEEFDKLETLFEGKLIKYVNKDSVKGLAFALKIIINIVYGLTAATFDNAFRDKRNIDNIVAKRGALFMVHLKRKVQELGYTVAHIKTDCIKIPNADANIIGIIKEEGIKYGYEFEIEAEYEKLCLVNDSVYIGRYKEGTYQGCCWNAVGAEFMHPYIFKTLFTNEEIEFEDLCETKAVTNSKMWLNTSGTDDPSKFLFVGVVGRFVPVVDTLGGELLREKEGKYYAVTGTKGYHWMEADVFKELYDVKKDIDWSYYEKLVSNARKSIANFGKF